MGFPVYDYRNDIRNVLITPQIRSRFMKMKPGFVAPLHTHDLGHEVFLVLQGAAVFEIDGECEELSAGQMCVALANQSHGVRVTSDVPMIMYLSVTPHIQPTHTFWADGERLPHRFVSSSDYDVETDVSAAIADIIDRHVQAAEHIADAARAAADQQESLRQKLETAIARGDEEAAVRTRNEMWDALSPTYARAFELADIWNDLAPRAGT